MNADINGDGEIDFEEFVQHFTDVLDMLSFDEKLQTGLINFKQEGKASGRM